MTFHWNKQQIVKKHTIKPTKIPKASATKSFQLQPELGLFLSPISFPMDNPVANTAPNKLAMIAG